MKSIVFLMCMLAVGASWAEETVVLKNGKLVEGTIVVQNENRVEIIVDGGKEFYERSEIDHIDSAQTTKERKEAFQAKMKSEGRQFFHGKWVTQEEKQAEEDRLDAKKVDAREREKLKDKMVSEGKVYFQNRWMLPEEKEALLEKIQRASEDRAKRSKNAPIGVSYRDAIAGLDEYFDMEKSPTSDGTERYLGKSKGDGSGILEIIGAKDNISSATVGVFFDGTLAQKSSTKNILFNTAYLLRLLKNTVPEFTADDFQKSISDLNAKVLKMSKGLELLT